MADRPAAYWYVGREPESDGVFRIHHERCVHGPGVGDRRIVGLYFAGCAEGALSQATRMLSREKTGVRVESCRACENGRVYLVSKRPGQETRLVHEEGCWQAVSEEQGGLVLGAYGEASAAIEEAWERELEAEPCGSCMAAIMRDRERRELAAEPA